MEKTNIFKEKPLYTKQELDKMGFSWYQIRKLIEAGILKKLNSHVYESKIYTDVINDFNYVNVFIPDGVICKLSASNYYGYTNFMPRSINVSISCDKKINKLPSYPQIDLSYPRGNRYSSGIVEINDGNNHFKIYSKEKTVCDILINRTKIDSEEIKNVLVGYLNDKERDLNKLYKLAIELKCDKTLRTYMEVLLWDERYLYYEALMFTNKTLKTSICATDINSVFLFIIYKPI